MLTGLLGQSFVAALAPSLNGGQKSRENVTPHIHDCLYFVLMSIKSVEPKSYEYIRKLSLGTRRVTIEF